MFENLSNKLDRAFKVLKGQGRITEINVASTIKEIRRALIDADVSYKVAKEITSKIREEAMGQNVLISVGGVIHMPDAGGTTGFKFTGTNIVFSSAPAAGESFFGVILAGADYVNAGVNYPDGTLGAPSITFTDDLDTGFYRAGSNTVALVSGGEKIAQFPTTQGTSGYAMVTDGGGNLSWGKAGGATGGGRD